MITNVVHKKEKKKKNGERIENKEEAVWRGRRETRR